MKEDLNIRLEYLLERFDEQALSEAEFAEMAKLIEEDEAAFEQYLDQVLVNVGLTDWANYKWPNDRDDTEAAKAKIASDLNEASRLRGSQSGTPTSGIPAAGKLSAANGLSRTTLALAALLLLSVGLFGAWHFFGPTPGNDGRPVAGGGDGTEPQDNSPSTRLPSVFVAQVVALSDEAELKKDEPREFLFRFKKNEEFSILKGDATIEFQSQAKLVVFGPASIQILDTDLVRVRHGHVTGFAEDGNFTVETPTAKIVDLGTEFGVEVDPTQGTKVSVFDGSVDVSAKSNSAPSPSRVLAGKAVQVTNDGELSHGIAGDQQIANPTSGNRIDQDLSLVDIVAGGDGTSLRIAGAIDPNTGNEDMNVPHPDENTRESNGQFNQNSRSKFIDGAFIADHDGNQQVVNSNGDRIDIELNDGTSWGAIWSRRKIANTFGDVLIEDFWGTQTQGFVGEALENSSLGVIGIHPNAGISFDLQGLRDQHGDNLGMFSATLMNLDNSKFRNPAWAQTNHSTANFRVLVDGELRFEKMSLTNADGPVPFNVPLKDTDRFLTLISSDAGDSNWFDHVVLIDPVIAR